MRKGLTLTLLTVAIAMISVQARAMAPTIGDIPSPVVGNYEAVTGAATANDRFVFLDAIDLNTMASDDATTASALLWTYSGSGTSGASNYLINGVNPINVGVGGVDPTSPTTAQIINKNDLDPVPGRDAFKNTITIRNKALSPIGAAGTNPGAAGIVAAQTQPVTFFCSDGSSFSQKTVYFYTDNTGNDRLSGGVFQPVKTDPITSMWNTNPSEWTPGGTNNVSRTAWNGSGVCLVGTMAGDNYGSVISAWPYFSIAANQVYKIKMNMLCSQVTGDKMPFWDIVLENYVSHTGEGLNLYIMDTLVFGNEGYANALTSAGSAFTWYWTPPAVATPQWNAGAFTSGNDLVNDPRLRFRLMDVDSVVGAQGSTKAGSVCIQSIEISAASITKATATTNLVNIGPTGTKLVQNTATGGNVAAVALAGSAVTFDATNGWVTFTPTAGLSQQQEQVELTPAGSAGYSADPASAAAAASFPIVWKTGKILRLQVGLSAPTATDQAHPYDAVVLLFNTMTNEINAESYQTAAANGIGAPKTGTPQTYTMFFNTNNETASTAAGVTGFHRLRWMFRAINSSSALWPTPADTLNTGSLRVHSVKVDEVVFQ